MALSVSEYKQIYDTKENKKLKDSVDESFMKAISHQENGIFWFYLKLKTEAKFANVYLRDKGWDVLIMEEYERCNCPLPIIPSGQIYATITCGCELKPIYYIECSYRDKPKEIDEE